MTTLVGGGGGIAGRGGCGSSADFSAAIDCWDGGPAEVVGRAGGTESAAASTLERVTVDL